MKYPWSCCKSFRKHYSIEWRYHWKIRLRGATLCRIGFHKWTTITHTDRHPDGARIYTGCWNCMKEMK